MTRVLVRIFLTLRIVAFSRNIERVASGRSQLIWEEARRRGIEMEQAIFLGKPLEHYRAKIRGEWVYFQSIPIPPELVVHDYEARLDDKFILAQELAKAGIPVPVSHTVFSLRGAKKAFDSLTKPVIIKPRNGSRGRHTTTHIKTHADLLAAFKLCREIAASMVIQEHFFGSVYRATVVGGKLVGFFKADPPRVIGDGKASIRELVAQKNKSRPEKLGDVQLGEDALAFLARQGLTADSVLPAGVAVDLSAKTGRFYGGYTRELFEQVHPDFAAHFEKAAQVMNAPVVGFDAIMEDPAKDPAAQKWGIIEGNSLPFIDLHYYAFEGKTRDIAPFIWDLWRQVR